MAPDNTARSVNCPDHGHVRPAFVCRHLFEQLLHREFTPIGFLEPDAQSEEPNGWCRQCDAVMGRERGWNDASEEFAGVKLVCSECFARVRAAQQTFEQAE